MVLGANKAYYLSEDLELLLHDVDTEEILVIINKEHLVSIQDGMANMYE